MVAGQWSRRHLLQRSAMLAAAANAVRAPSAQAETNSIADPMKPVPIPAQHPAREGIAEIAGAKLSYWDTGGAGTPIMLMHPASSDASIWPYQQPVFAAAGYRVIAFSRRGYGKSSAVAADNPGSASEDLHQLAAFLGLDRFHIVASADGCAFANDYALSHPEKVRAMVLTSGLGGGQDPDYLAITQALTPKGYSDLPVAFRELGPSYRAANPEGVKAWSALTEKAITGNRYGQSFVNIINWASLGRMRVPVLLVTGDADLNAPPAIIRMFAARIPGAEMALIPEAGHSSHWEQPQSFNRIVLDFIGRH